MSTSEALTDYYNHIIKQPLLSLEEEKELVDIIYYRDCSEAEKKRAKDKLITSNLRFVFQSARRRAKKLDSYAFEELVSLGNEGLIKGLEKYDPTKGVRFLSYAGWWVMQHQLKGQASMRLVALPLWKQQLGALISKEVEKKGRKLTDEELEQRFPEHKLRDLIDLQSSFYLSSSMSDFEEDTFLTPAIEDDVLEIIGKEELLKKISELPALEGTVLSLYYGVGDYDKYSIPDIAKRLDISVEVARRTVPRAIKRLQGLFLGVSRFSNER